MEEKQFIPALEASYQKLRKEYEEWQYATFKPKGIDIVTDSIINAMHEIEDLIETINSKQAYGN